MIQAEETTDRQSNSSYEFAQRQNVVLDDYRVSFVIRKKESKSIS